MNDRTVKIKKFIADMDSLEEVAVEMKIGENCIKSQQVKAKLLADWMYRFGAKIKELEKKTGETWRANQRRNSSGRQSVHLQKLQEVE